MQIFIFDNVTNSLQIDDYCILLIKEFKKLWEPERNKCPEDKTGKKRLRAFKEMTYIYLALDFKSPYFKYLEKDKHEAALADSGLSEEDLKDPDFINAFHKYQEMQDADPFLSLIKSAYKNLYKMQVYLDSIDYSEVDADGRPIHKLADVMKFYEQIGKQRISLKAIEDMHRNEQEAAAALRGDMETGLYD